jgi:hypothetical protein
MRSGAPASTQLPPANADIRPQTSLDNKPNVRQASNRQSHPSRSNRKPESDRLLEGSKATGSSGKPRLTNLMELTIDTSWWTRYRSSDNNPDLDPNFVFPQAVPDLFKGPHTAIPRSDDDLKPNRHIQAIANTAGFHMPTIEQGGNSLYPAMAQRASSVEVLRILISIGPTETMHFQTWSDKAGNAPPLTDPRTG